MAAQLVDQQTEDRFRLIDTTVLGRKKDCTLCLPDPRVSRQHAMIRKQGIGEFWFYDLGSINGSYINDERVVETRRLNHDDIIRISDFAFTFQSEDPEADRDDEVRFQRATVTDIKTLPVLLLASDICNFDQFEEKLERDELAQIVGGWYRECTQALQSHEATIDKFVNRAVLAYWMETEIPVREQVLEAALALQQACRFIMDDYSDLLEEHDLSFDATVAMHLGKVAHGVMSEGVYTMMGEPVNVALRLENLAGKLDEEIIASNEFLNGWGEAIALFRDRGRHIIRGQSAPIQIFGLRASED
jgi:adenylate cyclase